jgi:hypothetical protein
MDKLINLMQSVTEDYRAFAWLILGVLLPVLVMVGLTTLYWVSNGGLRCECSELISERKSCAEPNEESNVYRKPA